MTLLEQIQKQIRQLPPERQQEVLDFVTFLGQGLAPKMPARRRTLRKHPAFGSWRNRNIDALKYQQSLHAEWDNRS